MQQIADWLKTLGMSEYAQRFAENDIDIAVLPHLTAQHLKDLGVSLGHRLKMLHAVAQLADAAPTTPEPAPVTEPKSQDAAERRQAQNGHAAVTRRQSLLGVKATSRIYEYTP